MLDMTPLFSWCQWNLQLSQSSSRIRAINCCAFQKVKNYLSAWQRGLPFDSFCLASCIPPRSKSNCQIYCHIFYPPNSTYSRPILKHSVKWGLYLFWTDIHLMLQNEDYTFFYLTVILMLIRKLTFITHYYYGEIQAIEIKRTTNCTDIWLEHHRQGNFITHT